MTQGNDLRIQVPKAARDLLNPARYLVLAGGRGSGKSHFFANLLVARCVRDKGIRALCVREVQKSIKESVKRLIEDKIISLGLSSQFDVLQNEIRTPGGGTISFTGMNQHNSESVKSFEAASICWIEEAQTLSSISLELIRPTIRMPGSQLWFSMNPRSPTDPVYDFFFGLKPPENAVIRRLLYSDNPWFPPELHEERIHDMSTNRDRYGHIWLGELEPTVVGAIWDRATLHTCRLQNVPPDIERIVVAVDPAVSAEAHSDEHGIVAAGRQGEKAYVLEDASLKGSPRQWAERAIQTYDKWDADAIVVERNQGGDMVKHTLHTVRPGVPVIEVVATRGKHVRAEPIAALYAAGRVHHVGTFDRLEDQYCQITAAGYEGEGSPDRADAAIWALTELLPPLMRKSHGDIDWDKSETSGRGWLGS
jgi:hypothetical protein